MVDEEWWPPCVPSSRRNRNRYTSGPGGMDRRFDAADTRLDAVDKRFDAVDARMGRREHDLRPLPADVDILKKDMTMVKSDHDHRMVFPGTLERSVASCTSQITTDSKSDIKEWI